MAERTFDPPLAMLKALQGVPIIESYSSPRLSILYVKSGAFMDSPSPALIMHAADVQIMAVAIERGTRMSDLETQFEGTRRYLAKRIDESAARAVRRLDRRVDLMNERCQVPGCRRYLGHPAGRHTTSERQETT